MTAKELFEAKGFEQEITDTYIGYNKDEHFIRFDRNQPMFWSNIQDTSELRPAIEQQKKDMGWVE